MKRATNEFPARRLALAAAMLGMLVASAVPAQQSADAQAAPVPAATGPEATPPPPAPDAGTGKNAGAAKSVPPPGTPADAPRKPAAATGSPQRFEPTEKVRPDFDVAFPVDI